MRQLLLGLSKAQEIKPLRSELTERLTRLKQGFSVCWFHNRILFETIERLIFFIDDNNGYFWKHLLRLRAFNENEEIYVWKNNQGLTGRFRTDGEGEETSYIDAQQVLWGTRFEELKDGTVELAEQRGISFKIPKEFLSEESISISSRLILTTRNYIEHNEIGQASFVDSRFVSISPRGY
ncbi:MAG TPA: TIGR03984 family CRISPR-associated protein [Kosmotogaceae bacterium]|nr:TIGR03984 family CRISPR-associated protein [Kosmotogaceae bacterium]